MREDLAAVNVTSMSTLAEVIISSAVKTAKRIADPANKLVFCNEKQPCQESANSKSSSLRASLHHFCYRHFRD